MEEINFFRDITGYKMTNHNCNDNIRKGRRITDIKSIIKSNQEKQNYYATTD
jgi:hypothetical protein